MYPGSLPLVFNGSVPGHEKLNCSMYAGVQCTQVFNLTGSTKALISGQKSTYFLENADFF